MQKKKPYAVTCALVYLCRAVSGSKSIQEKVKALFETSSQVTAEVNNVFDQAYDVVLNYPMPMRNYRFGIAIEL